MAIFLTTLSTIAVGLTSGLYWSFAIAVMPGLRDVDDRTFVTVMRAINRRILNPWFLPVFLGSLLLPIVTAVSLLGSDDGGAKRWGIASALLATIPFAITAGGNVPLNNALDAAGASEDHAGTRRAFEPGWTRLNRWRTITSTVALAAMIGTALAQR